MSRTESTQQKNHLNIKRRQICEGVQRVPEPSSIRGAINILASARVTSLHYTRVVGSERHRHAANSVPQLVEFLAKHRSTGVYRCEDGFIFSPSNRPPQFVDLVDDVDDREFVNAEEVQSSE